MLDKAKNVYPEISKYDLDNGKISMKQLMKQREKVDKKRLIKHHVESHKKVTKLMHEDLVMRSDSKMAKIDSLKHMRKTHL